MVLGHVETLVNVNPAEIPSTVQFPLEEILVRYPDRWGEVNGKWMRHGRGRLWDMGFGPASDAERLHNLGFTMGGYEINPHAVDAARRRMDFFGSQGDVRFFGLGAPEIAWDTLTYLEAVDAIRFQAVFPSLLGDSWKMALEAADMMLVPGKYLFIADFMQADQVYTELYSRKDLLVAQVWAESSRRWRRRYEVNQEAFGGLGLPWGAFAVGAVGPHKFEVDWTEDVELLRTLYKLREVLPEGFERFAGHLDVNELVLHLLDLGYAIEDLQFVPRRSRATTRERRWTVAPGFWLVARKGEEYKYDPFKIGLSARNPKRVYEISQERKRKCERETGNLAEYWQAYYRGLLPRVPKSQLPVFLDLARKVGVNV